MRKAMSQKEMVLRYMKKHGKISDMDAVYDLGVHRLSARIADLRAENYDIETRWATCKNRHGKTIRFGEYYLGKDKK